MGFGTRQDATLAEEHNWLQGAAEYADDEITSKFSKESEQIQIDYSIQQFSHLPRVLSQTPSVIQPFIEPPALFSNSTEFNSTLNLETWLRDIGPEYRPILLPDDIKPCILPSEMSTASICDYLSASLRRALVFESVSDSSRSRKTGSRTDSTPGNACRCCCWLFVTFSLIVDHSRPVRSSASTKDAIYAISGAFEYLGLTDLMLHHIIMIFLF